MLPAALTMPSDRILLPETLAVAFTLPPVTLPVALINPAVNTLAPVTLPTALTMPPLILFYLLPSGQPHAHRQRT